MKLEGNEVIHIDDKTDNNNKYAFIGIFGVNDLEYFWRDLENNSHNFIDNELQVSNGLSALINHKLYAEYFKWFDVGTSNAYKYALNNFPDGKPYIG